ncbi:hypothetical protein N5E66_08870 [Acinetobacter johnsonii]|uniref:hypothetical protein n=1 Tax=Gammaproteobacteria TaxID=1236 RepID=UPI000DF05EFB|nr:MULTISPECIES: hypothetical protein [Gammaproteobacteria]AXF44562.1 hypothetical protein DT536_07500 [Acinetobacter johnsonii]MBC6626266.1 hypothetical protein [Pseudomonas sp.]MDH1488294.1 hypothetical protein [Acinetobacter johnsonii]MDH1614226.1 hypothetical protein [Acinetobacter johnsonii]
MNKKHKLEQFYSAINDLIRNAIERKSSKHFLSKKYLNVSEALSMYSNISVEARYPHEKSGFKGACITDAMKRSNFFQSTVKKLGEYSV